MRCNHCDPTSTAAACPRCTILLPKLTLAHEVMKPEEKALETVRGVLSGVGLESLREGDESELQHIWEVLIGSAPSIGAVPGLEAGNGRVSWDDDEIAEWQEYLELHTSEELDDLHFELPLPCGSVYERRGNGHYIDDSRLQGPLPSHDLATFLSQDVEGRKHEEFNDWGVLLAALAAACWTGSDPMSLGWVQQRIYDSAPAILNEELRSLIDRNFGHIFAGVGMHPFWHFACDRSDSSIDDTLADNETLHPKQWKKLEYTLGSIARAWREIFQSDGEKSRSIPYLPSLVVMDDRLHLLCRSSNGFCVSRIPLDADVWRMVVAWSLYPPNSEIGQYLRAIQWLLLQDDESEEIAPLPERRALQFLSSIWSNFGDAVSLTTANNIAIQGESGLAYRIGISSSRTEWDLSIHAFRNMADATTEKNGIPVCIQLNSEKFGFPLGDRIATFLLALRGDSSTANSISTLQDLHKSWFGNTAWFGNHRQSKSQWKKMEGAHPNGFVEHDDGDDDWLEEAWEMEEEEYWDEEELLHAPPTPEDPEDRGLTLPQLPWCTPEVSPPEEEDESDMSVWRMVADALGERMEG